MTTPAKKFHEIPAALADVAMIDGPTCAVSAGISLSSWHELVRKGEAPQPVLQGARCTRWQQGQIRQWLIERASKFDVEAANRLRAHATKASALARTPAARAKGLATRQANAAVKSLAQSQSRAEA
jgi:predicted DNA-binding transcriptional regulator AlpA